jgi:hypothetical protein
LEDCKAKFKIAWARKCAGLTDRAITKARELQLADELESAPAPCMNDPDYFASSRLPQ